MSTPSSETRTYDSDTLGAVTTRMPKSWIASAVKRPGAFKRKAKAAGESTAAFARSHDTGSSRTANQARLAETFAKIRPKTSSLVDRITTLRGVGAFRKKTT